MNSVPATVAAAFAARCRIVTVPVLHSYLRFSVPSNLRTSSYFFSTEGVRGEKGWRTGRPPARQPECAGANVLFRENCPNIDLVVFGKRGAVYVQVKSSNKPASKDSVLIDGSPWTEEQLLNDAPIFNKHENAFQARQIVIVDRRENGETEFYIAPPKEIARIALKQGRTFYAKPKRNGEQRKMFRKEVPREELDKWRDAWEQITV